MKAAPARERRCGAIAVSGSEVYVAGSAVNSTSQVAVLWVNGGARTLLPMPSGMAYSFANAITVVTQ
jgi:hypothetical protein